MTQKDPGKTKGDLTLHCPVVPFLLTLVTQATFWLFSGSPVIWKTRLYLVCVYVCVCTDGVLSHTRADITIRMYSSIPSSSSSDIIAGT
jgi:hypothetical protein